MYKQAEDFFDHTISGKIATVTVGEYPMEDEDGNTKLRYTKQGQAVPIIIKATVSVDAGKYKKLFMAIRKGIHEDNSVEDIVQAFNEGKRMGDLEMSDETKKNIKKLNQLVMTRKRIQDNFDKANKNNG